MGIDMLHGPFHLKENVALICKSGTNILCLWTTGCINKKRNAQMCFDLKYRMAVMTQHHIEHGYPHIP